MKNSRKWFNMPPKSLFPAAANKIIIANVIAVLVVYYNQLGRPFIRSPVSQTLLYAYPIMSRKRYCYKIH